MIEILGSALKFFQHANFLIQMSCNEGTWAQFWLLSPLYGGPLKKIFYRNMYNNVLYWKFYCPTWFFILSVVNCGLNVVGINILIGRCRLIEKQNFRTLSHMQMKWSLLECGLVQLMADLTLSILAACNSIERRLTKRS